MVLTVGLLWVGRAQAIEPASAAGAGIELVGIEEISTARVLPIGGMVGPGVRVLADVELAAIRGRFAPPIPLPSRSKRKVILWDEALMENLGPALAPWGEGNEIRLQAGGF